MSNHVAALVVIYLISGFGFWIFSGIGYIADKILGKKPNLKRYHVLFAVLFIGHTIFVAVIVSAAWILDKLSEPLASWLTKDFK